MADYWCVVALSYNRGDAFVVAMSAEAESEGMFDEPDFIYRYGSDWVKKDHRPGLYRLTVSFPLDEHGDPDLWEEFNIDSIECLSEFPTLVSTKAADEFATINQRMRQIAEDQQ